MTTKFAYEMPDDIEPLFNAAYVDDMQYRSDNKYPEQSPNRYLQVLITFMLRSHWGIHVQD